MGRTPFLQTTLEEFDRLVSTNLRGTWICCQAAAAQMVKARYGRILNCSSLGAFSPRMGHSAYAATKLAIHALTQAMAGELAPYNILVNAYVPGTFETAMSRPAIEVAGVEALSTIGVRRFGKPEEIGRLVTFLVSPLNSYMSGSIIVVHGAKFSIQNPMKPWLDAGLI